MGVLDKLTLKTSPYAKILTSSRNCTAQCPGKLLVMNEVTGIANTLGLDDDCKHQQSSPGRLHVWDSQYGPTTEAFRIFREIICNTFMPWTPEVIGDNFEGRVESILLENGVVGRVRVTPIIAMKTKSNIANSFDECIQGNFVLSGELKVVQGKRTNIARPGDLVLYHSYAKMIHTVKPDVNGFFDNISFIIPKSHFYAVPNAEDLFYNCLLTKNEMIKPLENCLELIAKNLHSASSDELSSLLNACIALLPLSVGRFGNVVMKTETAKMGHIMSEVLNFIDKNISNPNLSARVTAEHLGVSIRYVHKLFAHLGTTFSSHLTAQRLEHIKSELVAFSDRHRVSVSALAFQWGFNDLSTFNRAFKERFGCTPSHFRVHSDNGTMDHTPHYGV
jgi:AraC family transcriptional activator of tynA and feaB